MRHWDFMRRLLAVAGPWESMNTMAPVMDHGDTMLVTRARAGERDALAALYDRHGRAVYTLALRMTANHATAEDVVQDTFCAQRKRWRGFAAMRRLVHG